MARFHDRWRAAHGAALPKNRRSVATIPKRNDLNKLNCVDLSQNLNTDAVDQSNESAFVYRVGVIA